MNSRLDPGTRRLPPVPSSVAEARRIVRRALEECGRLDLAETAELLVSEVVTNALVHAGTAVDLGVMATESGVRVEVRDGSPHLPTRRQYAVTAGTGRGLAMLEDFVDEWGVASEPAGKTVWFELSSTSGERHGAPHPATPAPAAVDAHRPGIVQVELRNMPVLLHVAWQQHAQALLREYLLFTMVEDEGDAIQVHARATDALALVAEHTPDAPDWDDPSSVILNAVEPGVSVDFVTVPVPVGSVENFRTLDYTLEVVVTLANEGALLTPVTQPEVQQLRRWICREVARQSEGLPPTPWAAEHDPTGATTLDPLADIRSRLDLGAAAIVADDTSRIVSVSDEALALLGWHDESELVGHRIVKIVPPRYRQAHLAGFTLHFVTGRDPLLGTPVVVPALRADGTEVEVELTITGRPIGEGRKIFVAQLRPV